MHMFLDNNCAPPLLSAYHACLHVRPVSNRLGNLVLGRLYGSSETFLEASTYTHVSRYNRKSNDSSSSSSSLVYYLLLNFTHTILTSNLNKESFCSAWSVSVVVVHPHAFSLDAFYFIF
jgi:hypothetical protein